jgi:hypothetical protein
MSILSLYGQAIGSRAKKVTTYLQSLTNTKQQSKLVNQAKTPTKSAMSNVLDKNSAYDQEKIDKYLG